MLSTNISNAILFGSTLAIGSGYGVPTSEEWPGLPWALNARIAERMTPSELWMFSIKLTGNGRCSLVERAIPNPRERRQTVSVDQLSKRPLAPLIPPS